MLVYQRVSPYCFTHCSLFFMHHNKGCVRSGHQWSPDSGEKTVKKRPTLPSDSDIFDEMAMRPRFSACDQPHKAHKARQGVFLKMWRTLPSGGYFLECGIADEYAGS